MVETDTGFTIFLGGLGNFNFFGRLSISFSFQKDLQACRF